MTGLPSIPRKETTVLFLHIPKTAGLTLYDILNREYGSSRIYTFKGGRQKLESALTQFKHLPDHKRARYKLLRGHYPFGLHQYIPGSSTYITFLRQPVSRVISHYYYVQKTQEHALHEQVINEKMDLLTYVTSGINPELDNGQTRLLAGISDADIPFGKCSIDLLELAKSNLAQHFAVVGVTEQFDKALVLMHHVLQWHWPPVYIRRNVSQIKATVPTDIQAQIAHYNQYDRALYDHAKNLMDKWLSQIDPKDFITFQRQQEIYAPWGQISAKLRYWLKHY